MTLVNNKTDIYIQIKMHYQRLIELEILKTGDMLPSLRKVASELGVNPNTVDRAFRLLEEEGYIEIYPKKGAFVRNNNENILSGKLDILKTSLKDLKDKYSKEELIDIAIRITEGLYD